MLKCGIDIGGTTIKGALFEDGPTPVKIFSAETKGRLGRERILEQLFIVIDALATEKPDFIGFFCCPDAGISRCIFEDVKPLFSLLVQYRTTVQPNIRRRRTSQYLSAVLLFPSPKFCKRLRAFSISRKRSDQNVLHQHAVPQQHGGHHAATARWKSTRRRQVP